MAKLVSHVEIVDRRAHSGAVLHSGSSRSGLDAEVRNLEQLAAWMDSAFQIPGTKIRFGLDPILGLFPGLGDALTSLVAFYILQSAQRAGVSRLTLVRMGANVAMDFVAGSIPLAGDAFDIYWKTNHKNLELLRRHLRTGPTKRRAAASDWLFLGFLSAILLAILVGCVALALFVFGFLRSKLLS